MHDRSSRGSREDADSVLLFTNRLLPCRFFGTDEARASPRRTSTPLRHSDDTVKNRWVRVHSYDKGVRRARCPCFQRGQFCRHPIHQRMVEQLHIDLHLFGELTEMIERLNVLLDLFVGRWDENRRAEKSRDVGRPVIGHAKDERDGPRRVAG